MTGISSTSPLVEGGSLTGRVAELGGAGIAGCRMRAQTQDGSLVTRWADSDAEGDFDVGGLSTGSYLLVVEQHTCAGSQDRYYDADSPSQLTRNPARADSVAITLGAATPLPADLVVGG